MASGRVPKMKSTFIGMVYWMTCKALLERDAQVGDEMVCAVLAASPGRRGTHPTAEPVLATPTKRLLRVANAAL